MFDRRHFLRNLSLASAAIALQPVISVASTATPAAKTGQPTASASRSDLARFSALQGATFRVVETGQTVVLHQVEALQSCARTESFLLKFRGSIENPLSEQTYQLSHPDLGQVSVFLQPRRVVDESTCYSANFCRLA